MGTASTKAWKIQVAPETVARLQGISDSLGGSLSANEIAATAVFEVSRIPAAALWVVLGSVRYYADHPEEIAPQPGRRLALKSGAGQIAR